MLCSITQELRLQAVHAVGKREVDAWWNGDRDFPPHLDMGFAITLNHSSDADLEHEKIWALRCNGANFGSNPGREWFLSLQKGKVKSEVNLVGHSA